MDPKIKGLRILSRLNGLSQMGLLSQEEKSQIIPCIQNFMKTGDQTEIEKIYLLDVKNHDKLKEEIEKC